RWSSKCIVASHCVPPCTPASPRRPDALLDQLAAAEADRTLAAAQDEAAFDFYVAEVVAQLVEARRVQAALVEFPGLVEQCSRPLLELFGRQAPRVELLQQTPRVATEPAHLLSHRVVSRPLQALRERDRLRLLDLLGQRLGRCLFTDLTQAGAHRCFEFGRVAAR